MSISSIDMFKFDRTRSSSQEWEEGNRYHSQGEESSSQHSADMAGYHSSGEAAGGGGGLGQQLTDNIGSGNYHPGYASSLRSVGSQGSQGSISGGGGEGRHPRFAAVHHLMNGETQFPPSMYHAASDAAKSDAATVCSGSVLEDIEEESIMSDTPGTHNHHLLSSGSLKQQHYPSPPSSVKMAFGSAGGGLRRSNSAGNRLVDYADRSQEISEAVIPQQGVAFLPAAPTMRADEQDMGIHYNNMGPPLSRSLSMQGGGSSRAGSVKSFGSTAGSDVIAHVDPDDCGGSITDVQSLHSQEEATAPNPNELQSMKQQPEETGDSKPAASAMEEDSTSPPSPHPLLCDASHPSNGRISPGGTIYIGQGVRRYQGRYMHLPLKRFHHNGVHPQSVQGNNDQDMGRSDPNFPNFYGDNDQWEARYDPGYNDTWERESHLRRNHQRLARRDASPYDSRNNNRRDTQRTSPSRKRSRSRSRDRGPARSNERRRSRSRDPPSRGTAGNTNYHRDFRGHYRGGRGGNRRNSGRNGYRGGFGGRSSGTYRENTSGRGDSRSSRGDGGRGSSVGGRGRNYARDGRGPNSKHRRRW